MRIGPAAPPTPDREAGALRRIEAVLQRRNGDAVAGRIITEILAGEGKATPGHVDQEDLVYYYQTDCRGCALYLVPVSELRGQDISAVYDRGFAVCVD